MNKVISNKNSIILTRVFALIMLTMLLLGSFNLSFAKDGKGVGMGNLTVTMPKDAKTGYTVTGTENEKGWDGMLGSYRTVIMAVSAFAILTLGGAFVVAVTKIGTSAGNPQARSQAITACLWTGVAIAVIGASGIIFGFFYNVF